MYRTNTNYVNVGPSGLNIPRNSDQIGTGNTHGLKSTQLDVAKALEKLTLQWKTNKLTEKYPTWTVVLKCLSKTQNRKSHSFCDPNSITAIHTAVMAQRVTYPENV